MPTFISWLFQNPFTTLLLIGLIVISSYALWLRFRMRASKARFALAAIATMASCAAGLLAFLSGPVPLQIVNVVLSATRSFTGLASIPTIADEPNWVSVSIGSVVTILTLIFIYRFATITVRNWDGPITVNVNELAKREQDNSLSMLALVEARRLITSKNDPLASDVAINWQQHQADAPPTPAWHMLARELFETAFSEALFTPTGWRDRSQAWIGEIYLSNASDTAPLVLFIFDAEPTQDELIDRLDAFLADGAALTGAKLFATFNHGHSITEFEATARQLQIEIWPRPVLLRRGLKFTDYARDLVRRFDKDVLGGTEKTLGDTFVDVHVTGSDMHGREALDGILDRWLRETGRKQLAITGEYGQGKSTATLAFCVRWAKRYLANPDIAERAPLLIELRGQNPAETDPVTFLSGWCARYSLSAAKVYNLIRAGETVLIFEGFDELRNAGRAYDRHEHFNSLWRFAYPGTKVIFTGRPNFFLDEREKNRTLRNDVVDGAAGKAFTQLYQIDRLTEAEVEKVVMGFGASLGASIIAATQAHPAFFEIVSRPSMLPVVATIWEKIVSLRKQSQDLTSATLIELYLQAMYRRKEQEIENDRRVYAAPEGASYLLLPREVREFFTLAAVWKMVDTDARNTISRQTFDGVIRDLFDDALIAFQSAGTTPDIVQKMRAFQERFKDESKGDQLERVSNEIASSGLFVSDPAGGPSNLRLPHKQFYEYMIAKTAWIVLAHPQSTTSKLFRGVARNRNSFDKLLSEDQPLRFFSEIMGSDFSIFQTLRLRISVLSVANTLLMASALRYMWSLIWRRDHPDQKKEPAVDDTDEETRFRTAILVTSRWIAVPMLGIMILASFYFISTKERGLHTATAFALVYATALFSMFSYAFPNFITRSSTFVALRRIVSSQLTQIGAATTASALIEECLCVISRSSKSVILQREAELSAADPQREFAKREFQNSISPSA